MDLVLSSGFLAFGAHAGFLAAVEEADLQVDAICGTSSGALTGALWASGMDARALRAELFRRTPLQWASRGGRSGAGLLGLIGSWTSSASGCLRGSRTCRARSGSGWSPSAGHELDHHRPAPGGGRGVVRDPVGVRLDSARRAAGVGRRGGRPDRALRLAPVETRPVAGPPPDRSESRSGGRAAVGRVTLIRSPRSGATLWSLGAPESAFEHSRTVALQALR